MTLIRTPALAGLLLGAFFLAGCTAAQHAVVALGVERVRQAKDAEARVLKVSVCAMSLGAYYRVNTDAERRALGLLCGGNWERPLTADDLRTLRDLGDLLGGP